MNEDEALVVYVAEQIKAQLGGKHAVAGAKRVKLDGFIKKSPCVCDTERKDRKRPRAEALVFAVLHKAMESVASLMDATVNTGISELQLRHNDLQDLDIYTDGNETRRGPGPPCATLHQLILSDALSRFRLSYLTCLDLECNALGGEGVGVLCRAVLPLLPCLTRLHLASVGCNFSGLQTLVENMPEGLKMEVIGLTNNNLLPTESDLTSHPGLNCANGLGVLLGCTLVKLLRRYACTIRRVHLNHVGLDTSSVVCLAREVTHEVGEASLDRPSPPERKREKFPCLECIYMRQNANVKSDDVKAHLVGTDDRTDGESVCLLIDGVFLM